MRLLPFACIVLFLACGGSDRTAPAPAPPAPAPKLIYTDPAGGDYRLVRNASLSSDTHLVLDLVGPSGTLGRGLAFRLSVDAAKAAWTKPSASDADLLAPLILDLGSAPRILKTKVTGGTLETAFSQKGAAVSAKALNGVLARVALDPKTGATGTLSLAAAQAQLLPENGAPVGIAIAVGTAAMN